MARYERPERSVPAGAGAGESIEGLMLQAVSAMRQGRLNESITWLEKAAKIRPADAEIYRVLGLDYALGGMLKESESAFRRGVELDPNNAELYYFHGRALCELDRLPDSYRALERAIGLDRSSVKAWTALGQVQEKLDDPQAAARSYQKARELCGGQSASCAWPLLQLGNLALKQSGPEEAEPYLRQAAAARPDWAKPHFYLGKALDALGHLSAARVEMETAVRLDGNRSEYHYQLAQVCRRLGDRLQAESQLARYQALTEAERKKRAAAELGNP